MNTSIGRRVRTFATVCILLLVGACSPTPTTPINGLSEIAGTWIGNSSMGAPIKLVVNSNTVEFWFSGEKKDMKPPVIENGIMVLRSVKDPTGFISATRLADGTLVWRYRGNEGSSGPSTLRAVR